jgi:geranylgeranyl diphosphate synthase type II
MDNDDIRRGKPSCHKAYGEATALLCGDALLTEAFSVISNSTELDAEAKIKAVKALSDYSGIRGMIGGQQIDLMGEERRLTQSEHKKMNMLKTGALIKCACLMGCIAAGADEKAFAAANIYAENVGLAFQVTDDILDMGEEDEKTTYLTFMSKDEALEYARLLTNGAIEAISSYENSETLIELAKFLQERKV